MLISKGTGQHFFGGRDIEAVLYHDVSQLYAFVKTKTVYFTVFKLYFNKRFQSNYAKYNHYAFIM